MLPPFKQDSKIHNAPEFQAIGCVVTVHQEDDAAAAGTPPALACTSREPLGHSDLWAYGRNRRQP